jgi:hypothetical protein
MANAEAIERDVKVLEEFIVLYCRDHHVRNMGTGSVSAVQETVPVPSSSLCPDCQALLDYARLRRSECPYDPKPACRSCRTHCYQPSQRARIREVMRYSGIRVAATGGLRRLRGLFSRKGKPVAADRDGHEETKTAHS